MRLKNSNGKNLTPIQQRDSTLRKVRGTVEKYFDAKSTNGKVMRLLCNIFIMLVSVFFYFKAQQALYVQTDAELLSTYREFGKSLIKSTKMIGAANVGQIVFNTWTVYARTSDSKVAFLAAVGNLMITTYTSAAVPYIFSRSIDWDMLEAQAISRSSVMSIPNLTRMIAEIGAGQHIVPSSHRMAEEIRVDLIVPIYNFLLGMIRANLVTVTSDGLSLMHSLGILSLHSTNPMRRRATRQNQLKVNTPNNNRINNN